MGALIIACLASVVLYVLSSVKKFGVLKSFASIVVRS